MITVLTPFKQLLIESTMSKTDTNENMNEETISTSGKDEAMQVHIRISVRKGVSPAEILRNVCEALPRLVIEDRGDTEAISHNMHTAPPSGNATVDFQMVPMDDAITPTDVGEINTELTDADEEQRLAAYFAWTSSIIKDDSRAAPELEDKADEDAA